MGALGTISGRSGNLDSLLLSDSGRNLRKVLSGKEIPVPDYPELVQIDNTLPSTRLDSHVRKANRILENRCLPNFLRRYLAGNQYRAALAIADNNPELKNTPEYVDALIGMAEMRIASKRYVESREQLERALSVAPSDLRVLLLYGISNNIQCDYSRVGLSSPQKTIWKLIGGEGIKRDLPRAVESLRKAKNIYEAGIGITENEKPLARVIYFNLGKSMQNAIEEGSIETNIKNIEETIEAYHTSFMTEPSTTNSTSLDIHYSLAKLYRQLHSLKREQAAKKIPTGPLQISKAVNEEWNKAVSQGGKIGLDPYITAIESLRKAYELNKNFINPLDELARLHTELALYCKRKIAA